MNILPERYQRQYRDERVARYILTGGIGFSVVMSIWTVLLLPSFFYLYFQGNVLAEGNTQAQQRLEQALEFRKEIERVNALTQAAVASGGQSEYVRVILAKLFAAAPTGITLDRASYMRATRTVILSGTATTRTTLKTFVDVLAKLENVAQAEAPTENFLASTNAKFTITVTLK